MAQMSIMYHRSGMIKSHISSMPRLSTSWIKVGRKYYNLENAIAMESSTDDVVVTFPGQEIADVVWNKTIDGFLEKTVPIQIAFSGIEAAVVCEWVESRSTRIEGRRTTFVCGYINEQNRR